MFQLIGHKINTYHILKFTFPNFNHLQSLQRGRKARHSVAQERWKQKQHREQVRQQEHAATKIQSVQRGKAARKRVQQMRAQEEGEGKVGGKGEGERREEGEKEGEAEEKEESEVEANERDEVEISDEGKPGRTEAEEEKELAATRIQVREIHVLANKKGEREALLKICERHLRFETFHFVLTSENGNMPHPCSY